MTACRLKQAPLRHFCRQRLRQQKGQKSLRNESEKQIHLLTRKEKRTNRSRLFLRLFFRIIMPMPRRCRGTHSGGRRRASLTRLLRDREQRWRRTRSHLPEKPPVQCKSVVLW